MQVDYAYENRTVHRGLLQHDCNEDYIVTRDHRAIDSLRAAQLIFFMQPGTFLDQLPYNV